MGPLWSIAPAVRLCTHLGVAIADARRPAPANFNVPGADPAVVVGVGAPETWEALNKALPGSGVATTTTLLRPSGTKPTLSSIGGSGPRQQPCACWLG
jgi:hypothetical protein